MYVRNARFVYTHLLCIHEYKNTCIQHILVYTHPFTGSVRLQPGYLNQVTQVAVGSNGLLPLLHYLATVVDAFSQRLLGLEVEGYFFWIIFAVEAIRVDLHLVF